MCVCMCVYSIIKDMDLVWHMIPILYSTEKHNCL